MVHNQADAEELLQDTAALLWEKFDTYEEGTNFGAWAICVAKNKALEFLRSQQRARMIFDDKIYTSISRTAEIVSLDAVERFNALDTCLNQLVEQDRRLLVLRYQQNVAVKEIARMMGRSLNGLYQSYSRIIELLRSCAKRKLAQYGSIDQ